MRDLVEFLSKSLVSEPDAVRVEEVAEDGDLILEVSVAEDDLGRVIGRNGRVANAIRTVAKAAMARANERAREEGSPGAERRVLVEFLED
jgi:predicted RNA-binding protein YlqC (UPF0109 family)